MLEIINFAFSIFTRFFATLNSFELIEFPNGEKLTLLGFIVGIIAFRIILGLFFVGRDIGRGRND